MSFGGKNNWKYLFVHRASLVKTLFYDNWVKVLGHISYVAWHSLKFSESTLIYTGHIVQRASISSHVF